METKSICSKTSRYLKFSKKKKKKTFFIGSGLGPVSNSTEPVKIMTSVHF